MLIHGYLQLYNWLKLLQKKLNITVEKTESKKVEIVPILSLGYKPGYGLVSPIRIEPDSVLISGPESID